MKNVSARHPFRTIVCTLLAGILLAGVFLLGHVVTSRSTTDTGTSTGKEAKSETKRGQPLADPCPASTVRVSTAAELVKALGKARHGDVIGLAPGVYTGKFVATKSGTADDPIYLCGTGQSTLDGGGTSSGYVFHLDGAQYWHLDGFHVTDGQKGVVADHTAGSVIRNLTIDHIGDEALHLRRFSSDNLIVGNTISETGKHNAKFGEGIYIGTAQKNWCDISDCKADHSDRNVVADNTISRTTAESIDAKEGTTGGVVRGNSFDGSTLSAADSWVDVKGNSWLISGNTGTNSPMDGFQTHQILDGWGTNNTFRNNSAAVNGPGYGYSITPRLANVVECSNVASRAASGLSNIDCAGGSQ